MIRRNPSPNKIKLAGFGVGWSLSPEGGEPACVGKRTDELLGMGVLVNVAVGLEVNVETGVDVEVEVGVSVAVLVGLILVGLILTGTGVFVFLSFGSGVQ
jgi:hypothetical protein